MSDHLCHAPWQQPNHYGYIGGDYCTNHEQITYSRQLITGPLSGSSSGCRPYYSSTSFDERDQDGKEYLINRLIQAADVPSPSIDELTPQLLSPILPLSSNNDLNCPPPRASCHRSSAIQQNDDQKKKDPKQKKGNNIENQENLDANRKSRPSLLILHPDNQNFKKDDEARKNLRIQIGNSGEKDRTVYILSPTGPSNVSPKQTPSHLYSLNQNSTMHSEQHQAYIRQDVKTTNDHCQAKNTVSEPLWQVPVEPNDLSTHQKTRNAWDRPLIIPFTSYSHDLKNAWDRPLNLDD